MDQISRELRIIAWLCWVMLGMLFGGEIVIWMNVNDLAAAVAACGR